MLIDALKEIVRPPTPRKYVVEQTAPTEYRVTCNGALRGSHDLVGVATFVASITHADNTALYVKHGVETTEIFYNP